LFSLLPPAPLALKAEEKGAEIAARPQPQALSFSEMRARLDGSDRQAALSALQLALGELGDGVTLVWQRPAHGLKGRIKPVSAFRDDQGRICRHVVYWLALGRYERRVEGVACREPDGVWSLS
jgi:surface antigen